jgi:phosphoribosylformylglycinamidine cyclo-ligase
MRQGDSASEHLSYQDAGVDIDAGDAVVRGIRSLAAGATNERVLHGLGHFGGFYRIGPAGAGATLVASIDGVGTKLVVASLAGRHEYVGTDIVNHCINDILACGAEPLFFLDYFGTGKLDPDAALVVIGGIARACAAHGIALLGGETAEMPGLYSGHDYDLVGAIVGIVDASSIVDGSAIQTGDLLVGIPSDGFHTNGYSLIRAALGLNDSDASRERLQQPAPFDATQSLAEVLLQPHRSYREDVRSLLTSGAVHGMAHITGGGLPGNVARVIPDGLVAEIDRNAWVVPAVFDYVAESGHIANDECYRAFNMGIGFVAAVAPKRIDDVLALVEDSVVIGRVRAANDTGDTAERVVLLERAGRG